MAELMVELVFEQSAELHRPHGHLHPGVDRQDDICEPIDQVQEGASVEIWVVPSELTCEPLEHPQNTGDQEAH